MSDNNLRTEDIDKLGHALVTLTKELWVLKDRQKVLEAALAEASVLPADACDRHQPDEALTQALETERAQLINNVLGTLSRKD